MTKTFTCTFIKKLFFLSLITFFSVAHIFAQAPVISSFSPASGPAGTSVTITGTGFAPATASNIVFFGATMANVTAASTTSLMVTVPAGATYEPISVLNSNTALIGYSAKPFISTFTPSKGAITKDDFMPPVAFDTGGGCTAMAITDLDGDGKPDLVTLNQSNQSISVLRNTSASGSITAGSFAPKVDFSTGANGGRFRIAIGDLDGDGKPDVVVAGNTTVSIFRNTSTIGSITTSSFATRVDLDDVNGPYSIAISDLDGDGKPDIAVSNGSSGNAISIWRNISTIGSITTSSFEPRRDIGDKSLLPGHYCIAIADLDGDGIQDIVVDDSGDKTVSIFHDPAVLNNPYDSVASFATAGQTVISIAIGDLDGDGKPDLVAANRESNTVSVFRNMSTIGSITAGSFAAKIDFATGYFPYDVAIGDLDGDGKPDLAIANGNDLVTHPDPNNNTVSVLRNASTIGSITSNSFATKVDFASGPGSFGVVIGDFDGDGKPDIAISNDIPGTTSGTVSVLRNNPLFPPDTQATNIVFSNIATNSVTATWTNGDGPSRAVFISNTTTGSPLPAGSTTYTANPAYGLGSQIGSSGWYCIYNGTGNTVDLTGLSSGATYRVMVVEYNGSPGSENYQTSTATGNPASVTTVAGGTIAINSINVVTSSLTNAGSVQYAATFAIPVTGLTQSDFALATTGGINGASIASISGSGSNYTITVNTGTGDGTIGLNLVNATGLTPGIITPLPFTGQTYTIDKTPPVITLSSPSDSTLLSGTKAVTYSVKYFDVNFNASSLSAPNVTLNHSGSATGTISVSGSDTSYTVTVSNITGSGSLGISIAAGTATDSVGNAAAAAGPSKTFLIAPVLSGLTASTGPLAPLFADTTLNYTAVVNNAVNTITINPTLTDPNATVTVNATSPSTPVNLTVGLNIIQVKVTTLDGTATTIYTVGIVRAAPVITGKAPDISYSNGNIAIANNQPFSVTPTNKGGAVPQTHYGQVNLFAGSPSETPGYINDTGNLAQFNFVQQTIIDAVGNLYVADGFNNAIRMITPSGVVTTFAGSLTAVPGFTDGTGTAAGFNFPDGIAIDLNGNLYVSDYYNNAIRKVSPLGMVTTLYHTTNTFGPGGMCIDASGNVIVTAQDASQIIKITPAGVATVFAGSTMGYANGPSLTAQFNTPGDVQPDTLGNLYVADFNNSAIRKITPAGQVTTIAGSDAPTSTAGFADGVGAASLFNYPTGLYVAPGGVVYVADLYNNDIRRIMPDGTVNLIAGSANQAPGDADGIGTAAGFNEPDYIYIDGTGTGYISEIGGNRVRKLVLTGYALKGTLPAGLAFDPTTGIISGTPTVPFTATTDTVTAFNAFGYSTTIFHISYYLPSTIATLSNLVPGSGTLAPVFASGTTSYTDAVTYVTSSITVTPTTTDSTATVTVNGMAVASGTPSPSIPLAVGPNTITVVVTAQDGITTDTYTLTVTRLLSSDATLADLTLSSGTLSPTFAGGTTSYTASVSNATTNLNVTPTTNNNNATVTVNGIGVTSGTALGAIPLAVGPNTITTVVTAQDGTTTDTYTVVVTRAPSSIATLDDLTVSQGTLSPAFASGTTSYTDAVPNATTSITVTPTFADSTATITVNGTAVTSGTPSTAIPLSIGTNTITTVVIAQDGTTTDAYTVVVTRAASSDATLTNLTVSQGTLTPTFSAGTFDYTDNVPNSTASITVTPTSSDNTATITVNGTAVASGTASASIPMVIGPNTITTIVTAQEGITKDTYTVVVIRAPNSVATLANLAISQGTLTPAFDPATSSYTASVPNSVTGITETPTFTDPNATITLNGTPVASGSASGNIPLAVGPNTITTVVTAQDGTTTDTYTVVVTRAPSSIAALTDIAVSEGKLTPSFSSGTMAYADSASSDITSIKVMATVSDNTATILVNGKPVSSGTASDAIPLAPGNNTIIVLITAQNGTTTDTYTITVYRGNLLTNIDATNIITPNGDGKNDYWTIKDIGLYPQNNVNIFDKAGRLVYSKRGYNNDWDGTFNGSPLAEGTYYYVVDLGPYLPKFKGFISILRN